MARQISSIKYNFRPEFPDAAVDRYPSLTRALGNNYPGLEAASVDEDQWNASIGSSESSVPVVCPIQPICPWIPANDEIFSERMRKSSFDNSISGNNSSAESAAIGDYNGGRLWKDLRWF